MRHPSAGASFMGYSGTTGFMDPQKALDGGKKAMFKQSGEMSIKQYEKAKIPVPLPN
jgi:hypothetical protein